MKIKLMNSKKNRKGTYNHLINYKETFKAGLVQLITPYETYLN